MLRIAIVDDEAPARANLRAALAGIALEIQVTGEADNAADAVVLLNEQKPDVVLLDIWLGDGTGFDVLDQLEHNDTRVVFITAFDHYAVRAFKSGALHYLLKPVVRADLQEALQRAADEPAIAPGNVQQLRRSLLERLTIPTAEGYHVLAPDEIVRCVSDGNYTRFHLVNGDRVMASRTLKEFEGQLIPFGFMRVHLSHLVNMARVRMYLHRDGGTLVLQDGQEVPVSHRRRQEVLDALGRKGAKG
jgi:two-component system LytT family response regulator